MLWDHMFLSNTSWERSRSSGNTSCWTSFACNIIISTFLVENLWDHCFYTRVCYDFILWLQKVSSVKNQIGPKSPAREIKRQKSGWCWSLCLCCWRWVMCKCCGHNTKKCLRSVCMSRPSRSFRSFWFFSTASSNLVGTYFCGWRWTSC